MHKMYPAEQLVNEVADVVLRKHVLATDHIAQVALHQFHHEVHFVEGMPVAHPKDVLQRYDVLVAQKLKDVQLS